MSKLINWVETLTELTILLDSERDLHINDIIHLCNNNYWDIKENPNNNSKLNEFAIVEDNQYVIIHVDFETGNIITTNKEYISLLDKEIDMPIHFVINKGVPFVKHPRRQVKH